MCVLQIMYTHFVIFSQNRITLITTVAIIIKQCTLQSTYTYNNHDDCIVTVLHHAIMITNVLY